MGARSFGVHVRCLTRRKAGGTCRACKQPFAVGDAYRELIAIRSDVFDRPFVRETIHEGCIGADADSREWWQARR